MKLSEVLAVWDIIDVKPRADLGLCDLEAALDEVVGIENDIPQEQPEAP